MNIMDTYYGRIEIGEFRPTITGYKNIERFSDEKVWYLKTHEFIYIKFKCLCVESSFNKTTSIDFTLDNFPRLITNTPFIVRSTKLGHTKGTTHESHKMDCLSMKWQSLPDQLYYGKISCELIFRL